MNPRIIGIAGGSGSGKSTLVDHLTARLGSEGSDRLELDAYYRDQTALSEEERALLNYDHPDQIDWPLFRKHLRALACGNPVVVPSYDFATHARLATVRRLDPSPILFVDGILLFHDPVIRELLTLRVYLEVDDDVRLIRRLRRDIRERERTVDSVLNQYLATVRPMHRRFVEPTMRYAHLVLGPELPVEAAVDRVIESLAGGI